MASDQGPLFANTWAFFSIRISKSLSLVYLKLKSDSSDFSSVRIYDMCVCWGGGGGGVRGGGGLIHTAISKGN